MSYSDILTYMLLPLLFGSYVFTAIVYRMLSAQIADLVRNHLRHIEDALRAYGIKIEPDD